MTCTKYAPAIVRKLSIAIAIDVFDTQGVAEQAHLARRNSLSSCQKRHRVCLGLSLTSDIVVAGGCAPPILISGETNFR